MFFLCLLPFIDAQVKYTKKDKKNERERNYYGIIVN
jgi:hypothetical protein